MWATSMGSTRSHRPVPGERKSGIPEGTEMPAPVSATTRSAAAIRRASSAVAEAAPARVPIASGAPETRRAFAQKGVDALLGVGAGERLREGLLLCLDAGVEVARRRDALDLPQRERRLRGELARPRQGGVEQLVVLDHAVGEAQLERFVGEDGVADEVHLERLALAHEARQALGAAEAGDDAELDLGLAEQRRARGDAHVAR